MAAELEGLPPVETVDDVARQLRTRALELRQEAAGASQAGKAAEAERLCHEAAEMTRRACAVIAVLHQLRPDPHKLERPRTRVERLEDEAELEAGRQALAEVLGGQLVLFAGRGA